MKRSFYLSIQIHEQDIVHTVSRVLEDIKLDPKLLEIELTNEQIEDYRAIYFFSFL
ncbi:MAG: hypothetical protein HXY53_09595 [Nitrospirae bacterium]|nr:hypothetical protein [Nitrospirota bacterium]